MERSTEGVVEGTKLSDAAGQALDEVRKVSRDLAELIGGISVQTQKQSTSVSDVTRGMQGILKITEETTEGTKETNVSIGQLTKLAAELATPWRDSRSRIRRDTTPAAMRNTVTKENTTEFDVGPLSWVDGEIDQVLARALDSLAKFAAAPADRAPLAGPHPRSPGRRRDTDARPRPAGRRMRPRSSASSRTRGMMRGSGSSGGLSRPSIGRAQAPGVPCRLLNGAPFPSLRLFPEYEAMQLLSACRARRPHRSVLPRSFAARTPAPGPEEHHRQPKLAAHLLSQRRLFQQGLLLLLRGDPRARGDARSDRRHRVATTQPACAHSGGRSARSSRRSSQGSRPRAWG